MLSPYRPLLARPGARAFAAAGLLSRLPIAMYNISFILMVQITYDDYAMAGRVAAVGIVVWALQTVPTARLADRIGQRATMIPLTILHVIGVVLAIMTARQAGAEYMLWIATALASLSGPLGSLTRARWSHILDSDEDIHTAFALEGALDEVLFIGGPAVATVLATAVSPFSGLIVSTVGMVAGVAILVSQRGTEPPTRKEAGGQSLGWKLPLPVIAVAFVAVGLGMMFGAFDISTVGFFEESGHKALSGIALGVVSAGSFVGGIYYGSRHWHTALWKRTVLCTVALSVGFIGISLAPNLVWFCIIGFFAGATIAPTITNSDTVVQRVVERGQITEGMAWLRIGLGVGVAAGAWLAGILIEEHGARSGLYLAAGSSVLTFGIALIAIPWLKRGTEREADEEAVPPSEQLGDAFVEQPFTPPNI